MNALNCTLHDENGARSGRSTQYKPFEGVAGHTTPRQRFEDVSKRTAYLSAERTPEHGPKQSPGIELEPKVKNETQQAIRFAVEKRFQIMPEQKSECEFMQAQATRQPYIKSGANTPAWMGLHNYAILCARNLKLAYRDLLKVLIEIEKHQTYWQVEVTSLYQFCVRILDLPSHTAYDFIDVIRTSKEIPALAEAVISGRTTISKARRVCSVITVKNQKEWIEALSECSFELIKKMVAINNPRSIVPESLNYVSSDVLELRLAVSEVWRDLLVDTKDLLSQRERRAVSAEEALFILMSEFKSKNDPVKRAERAKARKQRMMTIDVDSAVVKPDAELDQLLTKAISENHEEYSDAGHVDLTHSSACDVPDLTDTKPGSGLASDEGEWSTESVILPNLNCFAQTTAKASTGDLARNKLERFTQAGSRARGESETREKREAAIPKSNAQTISWSGKAEHIQEDENKPSRYRPMTIEHEVDLRDQNRCTYTDRNGEQCASKRWLEKHHKIEFAQGGAHTLENLETLCSAHHRIRHLYQH